MINIEQVQDQIDLLFIKIQKLHQNAEPGELMNGTFLAVDYVYHYIEYILSDDTIDNFNMPFMDGLTFIKENDSSVITKIHFYGDKFHIDMNDYIDNKNRIAWRVEGDFDEFYAWIFGLKITL